MAYESLPVVRAVQAVLGRASTPDEAVTGVLEAIGDSMGWLVGGFWVREGDDEALAARCIWSARIHKGTGFATATREMRLPLGSGLPGRVWTEGETVWIEDVGEDPSFPNAGAARIAGLHAAVAFPVQHEGRMLGVLEFFTDVLRAPVQALLPVFDEIGREIGGFVTRHGFGAELSASLEEFALESGGEESAGEEAAAVESAGEESAGEESAGEESAGEESAGEESAGEGSAAKGSGEEEFADERSYDERSAGEG